MLVYLARDIPAFVMYCVNGESGSSLLIESTDSMIQFYNPGGAKDRYYKILRHISGFLIVNSPPRVVYNTVLHRVRYFP